MRVFISSPRKGLEEERESLAGLISALGHTPVRFEDLSAQATPSREACLAALASADACLFLLGPNYGHVFPETGQSATHDEWMHARHLGKAQLVYRKDGIRFEPAQHDFVRTVEAYATGRFRDSFSSTVDLLTKVTKALRELKAKPSPLEFGRLAQRPSVTWIAEGGNANTFDNGTEPPLEMHVIPIDHPGYSVREMDQLVESLTVRVRKSGYVESGLALGLARAQDHATVSVGSNERRGYDKPQHEEIREVRLYKTGQISIRATLPKDGMGFILDFEALPKQFAEMLRMVGALEIIPQGPVVVAGGVSPKGLISVDAFDSHRSRTLAQRLLLGNSGEVYRTEPDESVSLVALAEGADEVGRVLSRALFGQIPRY